MFKKSILLMSLFALVACIGYGCATSSEGKLFQAGTSTQFAGESTYQSIFYLYRVEEKLPPEKRTVSKETLETAKAWYLQGKAANDAYLAAARAGAATADLHQQVNIALTALAKIASDLGL